MTIQAWENGTVVRTKSGGDVGKISVTRRERILMDSGKVRVISVKFKGGMIRHPIGDLEKVEEEYIEDEAVLCNACGESDFRLFSNEGNIVYAICNECEEEMPL